MTPSAAASFSISVLAATISPGTWQRKAFAQDLVPHTISSDLQQFNVVRPVKSLANVMSAMMRIGLPLKEVIDRVTRNPAKAVRLD